MKQMIFNTSQCQKRLDNPGFEPRRGYVTRFILQQTSSLLNKYQC
jgi:hypothetical protein